MAVVVWIAVVACSFAWNCYYTKHTAMEMAEREAVANFEKDTAYRYWVADMGGVYVDISKARPNPYLAKIKYRDIITQSGRHLTLINPAYMTRMVHEKARKMYGVRGHITSLRPLNPGNAPDTWEKASLEAFENDKEKIFSLVSINGKDYLRFMKPLKTKKVCLKCHAAQGYREGDIRGGISVSVPFAPYAAVINENLVILSVAHGVIFILGLCVLFGAVFFLRRSSEELSYSKDRLTTLIEAMPDIVCFKDGKGRWMEANRADLELFDLIGVDFRGKKDSELAEYSEFYRDAFLLCEETDEIAWRKGDISRREEVISVSDGSRKVFDIIKVPIFNEDGARKGLVVLGRDITQIKEVQEKLQNILALQQLILQLASDFINISLEKFEEYIKRSLEMIGTFLAMDRGYICRFDRDRGTVTVTDQWRAPGVTAQLPDFREIPMEKWTETLFKGLSCYISAVADVPPGLLRDALEAGSINTFFGAPLTDNGQCIGFVGFDALRANCVFDEDSLVPLRMIAEIYSNLFRFKEIQEQLNTSERRYRELVETLPVGVYQNTPGPQGKFIMVNKALVQMLGYENSDELFTANVADLYPEKDTRKDFSERLMSKGMVENEEIRLRRKDGTLFHASITARSIRDPFRNNVYFEGILMDLSEKKEAEKLQAQFQQSQKLESVGRLAGGVAHDLNNLLVPILGYAEVLQAGLSAEDQKYRYAEQITKAGERARDIVQQLLTFSRKHIIQPKPVNLNSIIGGFKRLLRHTIREDIDIKLFLSPSLPIVEVDPGQIEQVILNLAVNAQDAMPHGGTLTIETSKVDIDEHYVTSHQGVNPGHYILLTVSDNGMGMEEETRKRIFEPFFTTKPKEQGTGLGLSTVYGIVKRHGGNIWVYSELGTGTTFKIYLPVTEKQEPEEDRSIEVNKDLYGNETVLLVEDDKEVRNLVSFILNKYGYDVIVASTPLDAVEKVSRLSGSLHLLLTDVIMPEMNGRELYEHLKSQFPLLKVLFMSGYTENVISDHGVLKKEVNFLPKPFSVKQVAAAVRDVLGPKKGSLS